MKQNFTVRQGALDGVEAFLSVAEHRSFRRAAAELGVTPSTISQAVRALEACGGARHRFGVSLGSPSLKQRLIYSNPTLLRHVLCLTPLSRKGLPIQDAPREKRMRAIPCLTDLTPDSSTSSERATGSKAFCAIRRNMKSPPMNGY